MGDHSTLGRKRWGHHKSHDVHSHFLPSAILAQTSAFSFVGAAFATSNGLCFWHCGIRLLPQLDHLLYLRSCKKYHRHKIFC